MRSLLLLLPVAAVAFVAARPAGTLPPTGGSFSPAASCAGAACHGGQDPTKPGAEFLTWTSDDPHARAYRVLLNDESKRIARNLRIGPAHEAAVCLACHAVDKAKSYHGEAMANRGRAEGVGCDACHGPSGDWLSLHYQPAWKTLTDREKQERYGFTPTKNLVSRAAVCAGCHVGEPGRDVNHDLIAAGHPRLAFEYARHHINPRYGKHWTEPTPNPTFELQAWYAGQVADLRAAVRLLAHRAAEADRGSAAWPELAEASCYSCHLALDPAKPRGGGGRNGRPAWQSWNAALVDLLPSAGEVCFPGVPAPTLPALAKLRAAMAKEAVTPADAAKLATAAAAELDGWFAALEAAERSTRPEAFPPTDLAKLGKLLAASAISADRSAIRDTDWDFAAQHSLAVGAVYHAAGGANSSVGGWKPAVEDIRDAVAFPRAVVVNSPKGYDPAKAAAGFRRLLEIIDGTGGRR